jgi:hypothetical protein
MHGYCKSKRTIRLWCETLPIGCRIPGGSHRLSLPLADLYAVGARRALGEFLDGGPAPLDQAKKAMHEKALAARVTRC